MSNSESTDLVIDEKRNSVQLRNFDQVWKLSSLLIKSNLFGTKNTSEVATKIITGMEMGISPIRAVRHIDTIEGKPSVSAQLSAAMIEMSSNYRFEVEEASIDFNEDYSQVVDGRAAVTIYKMGDDGEWVKRGTGEFTWGEAVHAGLTTKANWSNYPRDMLFARAMKRAKKMYASDVGIGRDYMPDELGSDDSPTVSVPDEVTEAAKSNGESPPEDDDIKEPQFEVEDDDTSDGGDESENFTPKKTTTETKEESLEVSEDQTQEVQDHSGSTKSSNGFDMEVKSSDEDESEDTEESDEVDHSNRLDEGEKISKKMNKLDDSLSQLSGRALLFEIGKYHYQIKDSWKDEYQDRALSILEDHEERLDLPYDPRRSEISYPTQKIINDADTALSNLSGDDLREQIRNYKSEAQTWDKPAGDIFLGVVERHEQRLDDTPDDGPTKGEMAEFHEGIEKAKTVLGMKVKDTHNWKPVHNLVDKLREKAQEKPHTEDQWDELKRVFKTYTTISRMRAAVIPDSDGSAPNTEEFNDILNEFAKTLNEWGDDWADQSYEIVKNEATRLSEEVDGFEVAFQQ